MDLSFCVVGSVLWCVFADGVPLFISPSIWYVFSGKFWWIWRMIKIMEVDDEDLGICMEKFALPRICSWNLAIASAIEVCIGIGNNLHLVLAIWRKSSIEKSYYGYWRGKSS